jgi:hypothetical protein
MGGPLWASASPLDFQGWQEMRYTPPGPGRPKGSPPNTHTTRVPTDSITVLDCQKSSGWGRHATYLRQGQQLWRAIGDGDGVFELRRTLAVSSYDGPAVWQHFGLVAASVNHRFDGENHAAL